MPLTLTLSRRERDGGLLIAPSQLLLFSGLGADERLFREQKKRFPDLRVIPWVQPLSAETLTEYASRLAEKMPWRPPGYIGGASFGGMIALEVAQILHPTGVFLFGSCRSRESIPVGLRFGAALAKFSPPLVFRLEQLFAAPIARSMGANDPEIAELLVDMYRSVPSSFIRWGFGAISRWQGVEDPGVPIHHIHGGNDRVIPSNRVRPTRIIAGAGHLLTLTHGEKVSDFLAEVIRRTP